MVNTTPIEYAINEIADDAILLEVINILIDFGSDISGAILLACRKGRVKIVETLVDHGALDIVGEYLPIMYAMLWQQREVHEFLIEKCENVTDEGILGRYLAFFPV